MVEFAIEHGLKDIDMGAVLNHTKQKMVNSKRDMAYFLMSKYVIVRALFGFFLRHTRIQGSDQLKFRKPTTGNK